MPFVLISLFVLSIFPVVLSGIGVYFRQKQFGHVDNNHPRAQQARLEGVGARAVAAHQNGWEALIVYTAVIFIAYASGVDLFSLALPALIFLIARVQHAAFYLANRATLRSLAYGVGMMDCIYIFYLAVSVDPAAAG